MSSKEEPIECDPLRLIETVHLVFRQHTRHQLRAVGVMRVNLRDLQRARAQPLLHHFDFVFLGELDALGEPVHDVPRAPGGEEIGHLDRLGVVGNHALHELDVGFGELDAG